MGNIWKIITGSIFKLSAKFYEKRDMYVMFEAFKFIVSNYLSDIQIRFNKKIISEFYNLPR